MIELSLSFVVVLVYINSKRWQAEVDDVRNSDQS